MKTILEYMPKVETKIEKEKECGLIRYTMRILIKKQETILKVIDKNFHKTYKLNETLNRNGIKISYSCMDNAKQNKNITKY